MANESQKTWQSGAQKIGTGRLDMSAPTALPLRDYYALHAPEPPNTWKISSPLDRARWSWSWADAMLQTRDEETTPESSVRPGTRRP